MVTPENLTGYKVSVKSAGLFPLVRHDRQFWAYFICKEATCSAQANLQTRFGETAMLRHSGAVLVTATELQYINKERSRCLIGLTSCAIIAARQAILRTFAHSVNLLQPSSSTQTNTRARKK